MATQKKETGSKSSRPKNPKAPMEDTTGRFEAEAEPEAVNAAGAPRSYATADIDPATARLDAGNESFAVEDERNASADAPSEKTEINFYGSDMLRLRLPKTFEFAETVIDEWKQDGRFEALPLPNPLAQLVAQVGLRKAKDIEKRLEEKGVFQMAKIGLDYAKSKLQR